MKRPASTPSLLAVLLLPTLGLSLLGCQPPATEKAPETLEAAPADTPAAAPETAAPVAAHDLSHTGFTRDLDGTPVRGEYTMEIQVGTPPQTFEVVMDSGSSNLILLGDSTVCDNCTAEKGNQYAPGQSSTAEDQQKTYQITYGSGQLDAVEYSDTVAVPGEGPGFTYTFGVMTHDAGVPNILGLAYAALAQPQDAPLTPWFDAYVSQTGIRNMFSMLMCGPAKGGKIELGGHSVEPTAYMEVVKQQWYVVAPDYLAVKGSDAELGSFEGVQTIVDSGTTELVVPEGMFEGILQAVQQAAESAGIELGEIQQGTYGIKGEPGDLSGLPTFQVVAGENRFDIAPSTYLTPVESEGGETVYMLAVSPSNQAILGQVFISNFYTVFDRESQPNRVGFTPVGELCS